MKYFYIFLLFTIGACTTCKNFTSQNQNGNMILNGRVSKSDLSNNKNFKWFDEGYTNYKPNPEIVNQLKPLKEDLKILVIAGTWCGDTQRELPHFYKLADAIGIPHKNIELIMVNEQKETNALNVSVLQVTNVPTFIFFKDGKEQGRIIEKAKNTLEEDIANLLHLM
ncbi:MAG: thioredoxin family protein [Bacteroidota bacterium]